MSAGCQGFSVDKAKAGGGRWEVLSLNLIKAAFMNHHLLLWVKSCCCLSFKADRTSCGLCDFVFRTIKKVYGCIWKCGDRFRALLFKTWNIPLLVLKSPVTTEVHANLSEFEGNHQAHRAVWVVSLHKFWCYWVTCVRFTWTYRCQSSCCQILI